MVATVTLIMLSGSLAIQLAKQLGAHVTGVDNAAKQDFMRSVGADDVIDYSGTRSSR
jgi:NADPH:quinone reductase-like Zn-dependent oxidoreductase